MFSVVSVSSQRNPLDLLKLVHIWAPFPLPTWGHPPDVLKLVHYVAHTSIGKRVVGLRLKDLATSAFSPHCWAELNRFFLKKKFWWTHAPVLDFCWCLQMGSKARVGSLIHLTEVYVMCIPWDSPLVQHLLISWWSAWQPVTVPHIPCFSRGRMPN